MTDDERDALANKVAGAMHRLLDHFESLPETQAGWLEAADDVEKIAALCREWAEAMP